MAKKPFPEKMVTREGDIRYLGHIPGVEPGRTTPLTQEEINKFLSAGKASTSEEHLTKHPQPTTDDE